MSDETSNDVVVWLKEMSGSGYLNLNADSQDLASQCLRMLDDNYPDEPPTTQDPSQIPPPANVNVDTLLHYLIDPTLRWLDKYVGIPKTDEARIMLLTIAGQETDWAARLQYGGPARSWWQFEKGGGVQGVLTHASSSDKIKAVCNALLISCDVNTVYEAMAWNGMLACSMARLLLYTDPSNLPSVGSVDQAWDYYERNWRPGAPHPEVWPDKYQTALDCMKS